MKKLLFLLSIILTISISSCLQINDKKLILEKSIANAVKKKIFSINKEKEPAYRDYIGPQTFTTHLKYVTTKNDTSFTVIDSVEKIDALYYWRQDSLIFSISPTLSLSSFIFLQHKENQEMYYEVGNHENANLFKLNEKDTSTFLLKVPFEKCKFIINRLPNKQSVDTIYGYLELKPRNIFMKTTTLPAKIPKNANTQS